MLILFDVDGTLVRSNGAGRRALRRAFEEQYEISDALKDIRLDGNTDLSILEEAFAHHLDRSSPSSEEVAQLLSRYLECLDEELQRPGLGYRVLPGAHDLLEALRRSCRHVVGLATGNIEGGARLKLKPGRLDHYFPFGGFGLDSALRSELVERGIRRGQVYAQSRVGRAFSPKEIWVIGDTELDVAAARAVGVRSVGVLCGASRRDALVSSRPDLLVESLADRALWNALELSE